VGTRPSKCLLPNTDLPKIPTCPHRPSDHARSPHLERPCRSLAILVPERHTFCVVQICTLLQNMSDGYETWRTIRSEAAAFFLREDYYSTYFYVGSHFFCCFSFEQKDPRGSVKGQVVVTSIHSRYHEDVRAVRFESESPIQFVHLYTNRPTTIDDLRSIHNKARTVAQEFTKSIKESVMQVYMAIAANMSLASCTKSTGHMLTTLVLTRDSSLTISFLTLHLKTHSVERDLTKRES
jgi:hypothetical protein